MTEEPEGEESTVADHNLVVGPAGSGSYTFPDEYTYATDGPSLHVLDGNGQVMMILASGTWTAAISGATFEWDASAGDDAEHHIGM